MKIHLLTLLSLILVSSVTYASSDEYRHFVGGFLGATTMGNETNFSYGFEYEYKLSKRWGAGVVFEKTNDAHHGDGVDVTLAAGYLHPWQELRFGVGFGQEKLAGDHGHTEDLIRLSVSYDFHLAGFGVAPTMAVDFIDGDTAKVIGVAFIKSF